MDNNLKKLQKEWYKKLKESGFEDVEQDEFNLKIWHSHRFLQKNRRATGHSTHSEDESYYTQAHRYMQAKQEYYQLAEHFLNSYKFKNEIDKFIWSEHSKGFGVRVISTKLKKQKVSNAYERTFKTLQMLKKELILYGSAE